MYISARFVTCNHSHVRHEHDAIWYDTVLHCNMYLLLIFVNLVTSPGTDNIRIDYGFTWPVNFHGWSPALTVATVRQATTSPKSYGELISNKVYTHDVRGTQIGREMHQ